MKNLLFLRQVTDQKKRQVYFPNIKKNSQHQFDIVCDNDNFLHKVEIFSFFKYLFLLFKFVEAKCYLHRDQI